MCSAPLTPAPVSETWGSHPAGVVQRFGVPACQVQCRDLGFPPAGCSAEIWGSRPPDVVQRRGVPTRPVRCRDLGFPPISSLAGPPTSADLLLAAEDPLTVACPPRSCTCTHPTSWTRLRTKARMLETHPGQLPSPRPALPQSASALTPWDAGGHSFTASCPDRLCFRGGRSCEVTLPHYWVWKCQLTT